MFKAITSNSFFGINSGNCCDMLVTYSEKIQVWARRWWDKCMLMMETDLVNSMWHLCSPWITGLGSEALQWETQLQFFNEHLTTLSFYDFFWLYCLLRVFFWESHLVSQWSISHKAGISVLFCEPLEGSGEVGVDSPVWSSSTYVRISVLCELQFPAKLRYELAKRGLGSAALEISGSGWPPRIPPGSCLILDAGKLRQIVISTMRPCPWLFLPLQWNSSQMDCLEILAFSCKLNPAQVIYHH